jgi:hypothetical protein
VHTRQERPSPEDAKTVLAAWVRGKTDRTKDEGSRRIEEVKAKNHARIVPPLSSFLLRSKQNLKEVQLL